MRVLSINVGEPKQVTVPDGQVLTSIFKAPVEGAVRVSRRNIAGDRQADLRVHGGPDKAVYAYPSEHYQLWQEELGRTDFVFGQFGENITTEGLLEDEVRIGDQYRVGTCLLEVSQPRFPCFKLGIRMNDASFLKTFLRSRRTGFYLRVIEEGEIAAGDEIERTAVGSTSIREVCDVTFGRPRDAEAQQCLLEDPKLAAAWKDLMRDFS